ncbi:retrotransposon protein, putative, ty1-copia subclass [Tanacetum coccineum]
MFVIEQPLPATPIADSATNVLLEWNAVYDVYNEVACLILGSMTVDLHRQFENSSPYDMIKEINAMFEKQAEVERFDLILTFHAFKQKEGKPVTTYVIQMKGYVDQLERLGYVLPHDLIVGLILNGLTKDFSGFVRNYNMHNMGKTVGELHAMLIEYEKGLPKKAETPQVMMIKGGKIQKANKKSLKVKGKGKANGKGKDKQVYIPKPKNPKPSAKEHPAKDDACHHCKEGFREARKLKQGALYLYVGNGVRAQVEAIGSFDLVLPNGLVICLDNCHYAPSILRGVVLVHRLVENGFHYRLAHISKKRIEKLQHEGLLKSTDDESFDQYVSCLSCKMTRKLFSHRPERATDLLGIIHTDVCGLLRHVSKQGASYFTTFTDDYSRYGYAYLLKHKHEVFETFKVFKNEVENQLGKTIKALRSDRGGEYISQEFKDYLKACGIVQQLTPPYTPQHNMDYALESATSILNMVPTKKVDKTPYELWYGKVPNLSYLKETMGYYFYFPPENKIVVVRYVEFFEKNLITQEVSGKAIDLEEIPNEDTSPSEITSKIPMKVKGFKPPQEEDILICRSQRTRRASNHLSLNVEAKEHSLGDLNEPTIYKAVMLVSESNKWIDAMNAEVQSMMDNMVWVLVDLPPGYKTVGSKWIFKKKTNMDGIVHTYKARLVAKGYTQLYGVDYEETFSPVADIRAIRILIEDIYKIVILMKTFIWYNLKDLGEAAFILGIKIYRDRSKRLIRLGQNAYMDKILKRYRMDNSKRGHIPMQERLDLNKTQGASTPKEVKRMQNVPYASTVGSIMYATAVKNILEYLRNNKDMFLVYGGNPEAKLRVDCYCDAGFETYRDDTKSQTGYVFILNGGAVDLKSSKQSTTAMSATEAEYIADSEAAIEAVWIRKLISGLGIVPTINEPIRMFCDNSAALHFANEPGVQRGARHYHRRYHYVRECIALGEIRFLKVHTDDNLDDPFTKALPKGKLTQHARSMGLHLASSFM